MLGNMETGRYGPMNMAAALLLWMSMKQCAEWGLFGCMSAQDRYACLLYIIHRGH